MPQFNKLPLQPNKKIPNVKGWTNPALYQKHTEMCKKDMNYGVICGKSNNIIVFDYDLYKCSENIKQVKLEDLIKKHGDTYIVSTPRGGYHVYHKYEDKYDHWTGKTGLLDGVLDIRTNGNYVVGAGSKTIEGNYKVVNGSVDNILIFSNNNMFEMINSQMHKNEENNSIKYVGSKQLPSYEMHDDLMNLINTNYLDNYEEWYKIGAALYNISPKYIKIFDKYSSKAKKYEGITPINNLWKSFETNPLKKITIRTLMYYAKESDYTAYNVWELKYLKSIADIIECGARETIEYISPDLKQSLVYSNKEWFVCDSNTNLWKRCNKPDLYFQIDLISRIDDYIKELVENKPDKYDESIINCMKIKKSIDKKSFNTQMIDYGVELLNNDLFYEKLDIYPDFWAFKDGLYNLKTKEFRKGFKSEDFITKTLDFNFPQNVKETDINEVSAIFKQICNEDIEFFEYVMRIFGYALTGRSKDHHEFYNLVGLRAGNGKSTLLDTLKATFPIYVDCIEQNTFLKSNSSSNVGKALTNIIGYRIVYSNEMPQGKDLNNELLKAFSDGSEYKTKVLYKSDQTINIQAKLFMTFNNTPSFDSCEGFKDRFRYLPFLVKFCRTKDIYEQFKHQPLTYMKDPNVQKQLDELRDAIVLFMADYSYKYYKSEWVTPKCVIDESKETCDDNSAFTDIWESLDKDSSYCLPKAFILDKYPKENFKLLKDEFKKKGIKYDAQKKHNRCKGCFIGVRIAEEEICYDSATDL